jgi:heterodisulfide reductase subunit C2
LSDGYFTTSQALLRGSLLRINTEQAFLNIIRMSSHENINSNTLVSKIKLHTSVNINKCYQCGKCSAGCPLADEMDYPSSMIMRMLQTEEPAMEEKVLASHSVWLCLSCEMCYGRCPMEIDIPKVMDYLRQKSLQENKVHKKAKNIVSFHMSFLDSIEKTGRLYEIGLIAGYKIRSKKLMQDVALAPVMYAKGKLALLPELIKGRKQLKKIFKKIIEQ